MLDLYTWIMTRARREDGQTMAEYAVVLGVITLIVLAALQALSGAITNALQAVVGVLGQA
jgi:Flp pilus assembly pilin Flp